uniref:SHC adaptor protein 2 n=1 Tax=Anser brachyrhynchus TaxID=132585 RepID=A0A8B9BJ30_9AVES
MDKMSLLQPKASAGGCWPFPEASCSPLKLIATREPCVPPLPRTPRVHGVHRGATLHEVPRLQYPDTGHQVGPRCCPRPGPVETGGLGRGWGALHASRWARGSDAAKGSAADRWAERGEGRWPQLGGRTDSPMTPGEAGGCCRSLGLVVPRAVGRGGSWEGAGVCSGNAAGLGACREAINRLYEAVPGVKGIWKKKAPNKALFSILGKSNLRFAGMSIAVNISVDGLNLMIPTTRQDTTDYVAYVAKDPINQRACHILECCDGLAQSVINTVGQAFELRFKQYLHSPPKVVVPPDRVLGMEESAWGEDDEAGEHDYYNSIPGKEPPPGGLIDSRLRHSTLLGHVRVQPPSSSPASQGGLAPRREQSSQPGPPWDLESQGQPCDGYLQADGHPLGPRDYEEHMYVNTQSLDTREPDTACRALEESPKKDLFDMRPFEDALKLHECIAGGGSSPPIEDQWPSPPTRKAPIAPTEEQLRREPWYHGKMSRRDAEKLLQMDGDFLVRDSITNPGQYVLTGMHCGQPKHLLLVDPEGVVRTKDVLFESISHLISHHRQNEQPIVAAESELHLRQVVRRKQ